MRCTNKPSRLTAEAIEHGIRATVPAARVEETLGEWARQFTVMADGILRALPPHQPGVDDTAPRREALLLREVGEALGAAAYAEVRFRLEG